MHRSDFSLFQQIQHRQITGNRVNTSQYISQHTAKANELIIKINKERKLVAKLACMDELKRYAIFGVDAAIDYFDKPLYFAFDLVELNDAFNAACADIGYQTLNPTLLYRAYRSFSWIDRLTSQLQFYRIQKGIDCLIAAANMKGEYAVKASYSLAYLYSSELDYHFQNKRPLDLASISYLHDQYSTALERLTDTEDKLTHFRLNNIDCDQIILNCEINFANLGCKQAINNLITWHANGNDSWHIEKDIIKSNEWKKRLQQLPDFLKSKYCEYYELALQNTKKFGYVSIGTPKVDIEYFIDVWCRIQFGPKQLEKTASALAEIKNEFIQEAESGNMTTCLFLGNTALKNKNLFEAKEWFLKTIEVSHASACVTPAKEAVIAARACYHIAIKEQADFSTQLKLLENAAHLGCIKSLLELGNMKLQSNSFDDAKKLFNLALTQSSSTHTPYQICAYLLERRGNYPIAIIEPYYINVKGEEIKRGSISGIEDLIFVLQKNQNNELASFWREIHHARRNNTNDDIAIVAQLIEKTIKFFAEYNSYSLESQLSTLRPN